MSVTYTRVWITLGESRADAAELVGDPGDDLDRLLVRRLADDRARRTDGGGAADDRDRADLVTSRLKLNASSYGEGGSPAGDAVRGHRPTVLRACPDDRLSAGSGAGS